MKRSILLSSTAVCFCIGAVVPQLAAPANDSPPNMKTDSASDPAATCRGDVHAFNGQMEKDGYWLGGSGYGYGYPMGGIG